MAQGFLDILGMAGGLQGPQDTFAFSEPDPGGPFSGMSLPSMDTAMGLLPKPGSVQLENTPASIVGPQKRSFSQVLADTLGSQGWGDTAATLRSMGGDTEALENRRLDLAGQRQERVLQQAREDMKREAAAARAASEGGQWNQHKFDEIWNANGGGHEYDPSRVAAYRKLYAPETGMTGSGVPYSRDPSSGDVTWGEGPPITEEQQARLDQADERNDALAAYRQAMIDNAINRTGIAQQQANISQGRLDLSRSRPPGSGRAAGAPARDLSKMSDADLDAMIAGLSGGRR